MAPIRRIRVCWVFFWGLMFTHASQVKVVEKISPAACVALMNSSNCRVYNFANKIEKQQYAPD